MSQLPHDDKRERSPLESAKVVIEHYNRIIETIDEHRLVLDRQEADFVMTVEDYQTLRDFACRNDAPPQAINLEGVDGDEMDKSADRAALLTRLMAAGEPRETTPSHEPRIDGWCPTCKGSGSMKGMTSGLGPDDHEIDVDCKTCGGTGAGTIPSAMGEREARYEKTLQEIASMHTVTHDTANRMTLIAAATLARNALNNSPDGGKQT